MSDNIIISRPLLKGTTTGGGGGGDIKKLYAIAEAPPGGNFFPFQNTKKRHYKNTTHYTLHNINNNVFFVQLINKQQLDEYMHH